MCWRGLSSMGRHISIPRPFAQWEGRAHPLAMKLALAVLLVASAAFAQEVRIAQQNRMGARFALIRAEYTLDGRTIYSVDDEVKLREAQNVPIATEQLAPGKHQLAVALVYRGAGLA